MAIIGNAFDFDKAMRSKTYAYECWRNSKYENNTMQIPADDMVKITAQWQSQIREWEEFANSDENAYEISDEAWEEGSLAGEEKAKEVSGHDGDMTEMGWDNGTNIVASAGSGVVGAIGIAGTAGATGVKALNGLRVLEKL